MTKAVKNTFVSAAAMERQEQLTARTLKDLEVTGNFTTDLMKNRPRESFIELMDWVEKTFFMSILPPGGHNLPRTKFIHNRIIIDGQFLLFAKSKGIKVQCLYRDSVVSWRTDLKTEKFFVQGVFKIVYRDMTFLHSALFHKGNQNEDEVSFFNIVRDWDTDEYLALRNEFEDWSQARDRSNLQIRVVEGDDISYMNDVSWDDLFLPVPLKTEIRQSVETFLTSKSFYDEVKIPWKRGMLLYGEPGNGKTSLIRVIVSNYNFKAVTIAAGTGDSALREAFSYAESQSPALLYFEDLDSIFQKVDPSLFLNLMDGIASRNGLMVIATANNIEQFASNITDRPSRFDRKYEIPLPDRNMCLRYLKKWFGKTLTEKKLQDLATHSVKYKFSYAYIKELYVSSVYSAIANDRKVPNVADVNHSLQQIMKDKNIGRGKKIIGIDRYVGDNQ